MKILQLTTHLNIGGIGKYVLNLSEAMKDRGHKIFVASSGGCLEKELAKDGIRHFCIDIRTKSELSPKIIKSFFAIKGIVKEEGIELIHAHTRVTAVAADLVSRVTGVPYITTCHGYFKRRLGRVWHGAWGVKVIAISEAVKRHLIDDFRLPEDKVELIYTGIDTECFNMDISEDNKMKWKKELGFLDTDIVIGTIGRLSPVKGQEILLEAASHAVNDVPPIKVLLVGDGPDEKRLRKIAGSLGIGDKVIFIKGSWGTKKLFSAMDIFVLPSIKEGLGLSLLEAMACGKPCIASKVGGIENVINDRENGLLFKTGNAEDLAHKIVDFINDRRMMDALGEKGKERVLENFTLLKMADCVERLYGKTINDRRWAMDEGRKTENAAIIRAKQPPIASREKILIINVNWLGDVIFSTPFIRAVRETCPHSYIACVVAPRCKEILDENPRVNELIIFDERGKEKSIAGKIDFIAGLRKKKFDTVFILHRSFTRALIAFLAGIKERIGYDTKKRGFLLTNSLREPRGDIHKAEYFLRLAEAIGACVSKKNYELFLTDADRKRAEAVLEASRIKPGERFAVLNPGGNWAPKRWPAENFSLLGERLAEKYGVRILISGSEKDEVLANEISKRIGQNAVSLCGRTGIRELAAIFEKAGLVISGDSGPMHISVSAGANTIAIFGPTDSAITGPYGGGNYTVIRKDIGCVVPCYDTGCRNNRCMKAVSVDDVMDIIEKKGYL